MLHQWMFLIMLLVSGFRLGGLAFLLSNDPNRLPTVIYCSTGAVVVLGLVLLCKRIILSFLRTRDLVFFFAMHTISVLLNLMVMKASRPLVVYNIDLIVTGSLFDILMSIVLIIKAVSEHRHVQFEPVAPVESVEPNEPV